MGAKSLTTERDHLAHLESVLSKLPQIEIKVTHHFSKGIYAREIFIPKGTIVIGKIHKHECLSIMSSGEKSVLVDGKIVRVKAPFTTVSKPGMKRIGYAHEDTVWTSIHATEETDLEKLESEIIAKDYSEVDSLTSEDLIQIEQLKELQCLG